MNGFWKTVVHSRVTQAVFVGVMKLLFRMRIRDYAMFPAPGPYIIVSNHASHLDLLIGLAGFIDIARHQQHPHRLPVIAAWAGALRMRVLGPLLRAVPCVGIERRRGQEAKRMAAVRELVRHVKDGRWLIFSAEGKRQEELGKFEEGPAFIALLTGVPVLPVTVRGAHNLYSDMKRMPRLWGRVEVVGHPLIDPKQFQSGEASRDEVLAKMTAAIREQVSAALDYGVQELPVRK
jgi:1-acyl-sn-glycerol-3-phosphate acyltransferase